MIPSGFVPAGTVADLGERLHVEHDYLIGAAVADEALVKLGRERDAVHQLQSRDRADHFALLAVHDRDFVAVRDKHAAGSAVGSQIVPKAVAGDRNFLDEVIAALRKRCAGKR